MENIDKELRETAVLLHGQDVIELSDVEAVTTEQITNKVFEMVDAIASHKQSVRLSCITICWHLRSLPCVLCILYRASSIY